MQITANRVLVIPDVHLRLKNVHRIWKKAEGEFDHTVFLGDYFDNFGDTPSQNQTMAIQLKRWLYDPAITCLLGNHDTHYMAPSVFTTCSGFETDKFNAIRCELNAAAWNRAHSHAFCHDYLLSHAGFDPRLKITPEDLNPEAMEVEEDRLMDSLAAGTYHPWLALSGRRGGPPGNIPGPFWQDWTEFRKHSVRAQIVGHTPSYFPRYEGRANGSSDICLDTHCVHYAIITESGATIHELYSK